MGASVLSCVIVALSSATLVPRRAFLRGEGCHACCSRPGCRRRHRRHRRHRRRCGCFRCPTLSSFRSGESSYAVRRAAPVGRRRPAAGHGVSVLAGVRTQASASKLDPLYLASSSAERLRPASSAADPTVGRCGRRLRGGNHGVIARSYFPSCARRGRLAERIDYCGQLRLIAAARAAQLPGRFVMVSSLLADQSLTDNPSARLLNSALGNVLEQKRKAEAALRSTPSLDWSIVRPGLLDVSRAQVCGLLLSPPTHLPKCIYLTGLLGVNRARRAAC